MGLAEVLGMTISVFGLTQDWADKIQKKMSKNIVVTPNIVKTTSRHWDSTNSVIVQNTSNKPLFSVQIIFWYDENQKLNFKSEKPTKEAMVKNLIINYGVVTFRGKVGDENIAMLEILRLLPNESVEIDLTIEKKGEVKIFPAEYDEKASKQIGISDGSFKYPFRPPFDMELSSISLLLKNKA